MITLYYIKGISSVDEPVFDKITQQKTFFSSKVAFQFDSGFYPPHFKNEIIISTEDISMRDPFNYLSLDYQDKEYYYFIDRIEYISEDALKLYVTMDVIQTYMFNCNFIRSDINRASINRWLREDKINRNYIRSNRSKGTMEQFSMKYLDDNIGWYVIILSGASTLYSPTKNTPFSEAVRAFLTGSSIQPNASTAEECMIAIPVSNNAKYPKISYGGSTYTTYSALVYLYMFGIVNGVISITYYNHNIFNRYLNYSYDNDVITITSKDTSKLRIQQFWHLVDAEAGDYVDYGMKFVAYSNLIIYEKEYEYTFNFNVNSSVTSLPSAAYCPVLLDENYIQVEYGERLGSTSYPLHMLVDHYAIECNCIVNYIDGGRSYYISEYSEDTDIYNTLITNMTIEQIPLYNDAWEQYLSQNLSTLMRGRALAIDQAMYKPIRSGLSNIGSQLSGSSMMRGFNGMYALGWDEIIKGNILSSSIGGAFNVGTSYMDALNEISIYSRSREMQEANVKATPDNQKIGNSCASDITTGVLRPYLKISKCSDFDNVWQDYEENGYDVAEHTSSNLFIYAGNRYYYDVIRVQSTQITLDDYINDETTISLIADRFKHGLRLWHTTNGELHAANIGDYKYDNVELIHISQ